MCHKLSDLLHLVRLYKDSWSLRFPSKSRRNFTSEIWAISLRYAIKLSCDSKLTIHGCRSLGNYELFILLNWSRFWNRCVPLFDFFESLRLLIINITDCYKFIIFDRQILNFQFQLCILILQIFYHHWWSCSIHLVFKFRFFWFDFGLNLIVYFLFLLLVVILTLFFVYF